VNPGDTATSIADRLAEEKLVSDRRAFLFVAIERDLTTKLNAGDYSLRKNMTPNELVSTLLAAPTLVYVDIPLRESLRLEQVTAKLQTLPLEMDVKQFYELAKHPPDSLIEEHPWLQQLGLPSGTSLEGFLYPATYTTEPGTSPTGALRAMVAKFNEVAAAENLERRAAAVHLTPYQVVIVASLVQREARVDSDGPKIARVIYNRLAAGIPLGIDASTLYGLGRSGGALSANDLAKATPYNLRKVKGLPPTPIASPGRVAIDAALAPAAGNWLYYVVMDKQGHHFFTNDYNAFLAQKAKSQREGLI
jgi:UPF0755 protein